MSTGVQTPTQQAAEQDAADVRTAAANDGDHGIRAASQALLSESDTYIGNSSARNPVDNAQYLKTLTTQLEKDGLLPAITIDFAHQKFKDLNTGGKVDSRDVRLDAAEVEAAARSAKVGTLDHVLLNKLNEMVKSGAIRDGINEVQLGQQMNAVEDANRLKVAKAAGDVLKNKDLFDAIDVAGPVKTKDGVVAQQDINAYLASDEGRSKTDKETRAKLAYLAMNWNDPEVRALQYQDPDKKENWYINSDTLAPGLDALEQKAKAAEIKPSRPVERLTSAEERTFFQNGATTVTEFPDGRTLTQEVKPGTNQTVNITEGHRLPSGEMHYAGWRYNAEDKKWTLYDGEKPMEDADNVSVENGKVVATKRRPAWGTVIQPGGDS